MKKIILLLLFATLGWQQAIAQAFTSGGLQYYILSPSEVEVGTQDYTSISGDIIIPEQVTYDSTTYTVKSITDYAFENCMDLTSVVIPNSVTRIGFAAFTNCYNLTSVNIPNSLTRIEEQTFYYCTSLSSITIPNSVTSIGVYAFIYTGLTSVTIPNSVTSIGGGAFGLCTRLTSVTIPNSVTTIEGYVFYGCSSLASVICNIASPLLIDGSVFGQIDQSAISLKVPAGSVSAYLEDSVWGLFSVSANAPSAPTASAQTFCSGATVADLTAIGTALQWYTASTGGSALATNTTLATGTYYVSQTENGTESDRTAVSVTVNTTPAPTASAQTFCGGATIANLDATGDNLKWYDVATEGTALATSTVLVSGNYYVSQTIGDCESARTALSVIVTPNTNNITVATACDSYTWANNNQTYNASGTYTGTTTNCVTQKLALTITPVPEAPTVANTSISDIALSITGACSGYNGVYKYIGLSNGKNKYALSSDPSTKIGYDGAKWFFYRELDWGVAEGFESTSVLPGLYPPTTGWSVKDCLNGTLTYSIINDVNTQSFCAGATIANLDATGDNLKWYDVASGGTALATSTVLVSGNYFVSQTVNGCESARTALAVIVNPLVSPTFTQVNTICSGATLSALPTTSLNGIAGTWSPAIDNTATTMYTFTPDAGQCGTTATMTIVVTPNTERITTITACGSYTWNGTTYDATGVYTGTTTNCVTEKLDLTITTPPTSFSFEGINYVVTSPSTVSVGINQGASGELVIPETVTNACGTYAVTSIDNYAFYGSGITSVSLPNSLVNIGYQSFQNCYQLNSLAIPDSVSSIGYFAFANCTSLTSFTIPSSITSIESGLFLGCSGLTSLTIPNTVTSISDSAFQQCTGLTSFTIPSSVSSIGYNAFYGCSGLTSITIPNTVTSIAFGAFNGCSGLTSVTLPNSITSIESYTFMNCIRLTSITIPNSVTSIGDQAFLSCSSLRSIKCDIETPLSINSNVFDGVNQGACALIVPIGSIATYQAAAVWQNFSPITCPNATDNITAVTACGSYTWPNNGQTYTDSGVYDGTTTNCVTEKLNLTITKPQAPFAEPQIFYNATTIEQLLAKGGNLKWYTEATGGTALNSAANVVTGTYYVSQSEDSCESDRTAVAITVTTIPSTMSFCDRTNIATAVGSRSLKFYWDIADDSALGGHLMLLTRTYFVTELVNGIESTPRVPVAVTLIGIPANPSAINASDTFLCKYIGTTNTVTYTTTPGASSYIWTVPAGVSIIDGQGTNTLTVDFHSATTSGAGTIGNISVNAINASGCSASRARTLALSTKLPTVPSKVTMSYNGVVQTKVGNFIGDASKTLVLDATDNSNSANSYTWELPAGISVVSGDPTTDKTIAIHLGSVTPGNTDLVFKVYSVASCGNSIARSLVVTRTAPAAPTTLALTNDAIAATTKITVVSAYTGKLNTTTLTLTATPSSAAGTEATSYKWVLPSGISIVDASATFVSENSGFTAYTSTSNVIKINLSGVGNVTSLLLKVYGVNGNGESLLSRDLKLTCAIPSKPGALTTASGSTATYHPSCGTITVKVPNVFGVTYTWAVKDGAVATVLSKNGDGNEATISVSKLPSAVNSSFKIGVVASNGIGSSETIYTIKLGTACSNNQKAIDDDKTTKVANEFKVIAYPNPSSNVFNVKIESLENTKSELSVYDSIGRLIEQLQAQTNEVELGSRYPAGVYNLIVKQGLNVKTVRVVKQ